MNLLKHETNSIFNNVKPPKVEEPKKEEEKKDETMKAEGDAEVDRGTEVTIVGICASCQPIPELNMSTPAASSLDANR